MKFMTMSIILIAKKFTLKENLFITLTILVGFSHSYSMTRKKEIWVSKKQKIQGKKEGTKKYEFSNKDKKKYR